MTRAKFLLLVLSLWLMTFSRAALATPPEAAENPSGPQPPGEFLRIRRASNGEPSAVETAIFRYASRQHKPPPWTVDLIGAVHVADRAYYDQLNKLFESYDAVLYELVAPHDARVPSPNQRTGNPVSAVQVAMKRLLNLEFQLDCIDYTKKNLVHADLTPAEFARSMNERGESFAQMFLRMLGQSIAAQSKDPGRSSDAALLAALFSKDRSQRLKQIMAEQFEDMVALTSVLDGPKGSTIITARNQRALEVLAAQIKKGRQRIGIFYGAAHLPDMEKKLLADFHVTRTDERWLTAWVMERESQPAQPKPAGND